MRTCIAAFALLASAACTPAMQDAYNKFEHAETVIVDAGRSKWRITDRADLNEMAVIAQMTGDQFVASTLTAGIAGRPQSHEIPQAMANFFAANGRRCTPGEIRSIFPDAYVATYTCS